MNDDRISELYLGEGRFATSVSRVPARMRIDWMVSQTRGRTLDIGSSQGIVTLLVGRAGHEVTGVDVEAPAIEYARKALAAESADVQQRVTFLHADIYDARLANQQFDTVLLGEILEHHASPRELWLRAVEFVAPNGKIVGTTPFGLHPHPDHKVTFYLRALVDTISGVGTLTHLGIEDGVIRFVVDKTPNAQAVDVSPEALLALSERGFLAIQETVELLKEDYNARGARIAEASQKLKALAERAQKTLDQTKAEHAAQLASEREAHRKMRARLQKLESYVSPPDDAGPRLRGFSALLSSVLREVNTGGLREAPLEALRKTYARVRRAADGSGE